MPYPSHATIRPGASRQRLLQLVADLHALGCTTEIKPQQRRLELVLSDEALAGLLSGNLSACLYRFDDVVEWHPEFRPAVVGGAPPRLPAG